MTPVVSLASRRKPQGPKPVEPPVYAPVFKPELLLAMAQLNAANSFGQRITFGSFTTERGLIDLDRHLVSVIDAAMKAREALGRKS